MVESLTSEAEWAALLRHTSSWELPNSPVLLVAPHPDDETLGAGGLIAAARERGIHVRIVAVTDGENAYPENDSNQIDALRLLRRQEQTCALERLGVSSENIIRLSLPDSAVETRQKDLVSSLLKLVSSDTHLLAPWKDDFHPDHRACGLAAEEVARVSGARLTSYFFWTWHQVLPAEVRRLHLGSFPLTPEIMSRKAEALLCHHSQLNRSSGDPILPEHLLAPARRSFETFLVT